MPIVPMTTNVTCHAAKHFLDSTSFFGDPPQKAIIRFHEGWMHIEPFGLAMIAAWARNMHLLGVTMEVENLSPCVDYAWRMGLFNHLDVDYAPERDTHEEAGRFLPLKQVRDGQDIKAVLADISALLHLHEEPDTLAAVRHCISELLYNVREHSGSSDGAFICAHRYSEGKPPRINIGVADCGVGIRQHLHESHPEVGESDSESIMLAMQPGITGVRSGMYGTPDNAGAGLFITRCMAKGTGGYFMLLSGDACYRLRRTNKQELQGELFQDPRYERHDLWEISSPWQGTVVSLEIRTDHIADYDAYFQWIRESMPKHESQKHRIRFT